MIEIKEKGYPKGSTPLNGYQVKYPEFCGAEFNTPKTRDCGCGFGKCEKGLVY